MSEYGITICLKTNLYVGSGFGFARVIDHISVRDSEGVAYIPGSSIKGKLRSTCKKIALALDKRICQTLDRPEMCKGEKLAERCVICRMFGSPFTQGRLIFSDARLEENEAERIRELYKITPFRVKAQNEVKTGVKLSRIRRISDSRHLFALESVAKALKFHGVIKVRDELSGLLNADLINEEETLLKYGLRAVTHLGGQKSRGLGRIEIRCPDLGL